MPGDARIRVAAAAESGSGANLFLTGSTSTLHLMMHIRGCAAESDAPLRRHADTSALPNGRRRGGDSARQAGGFRFYSLAGMIWLATEDGHITTRSSRKFSPLPILARRIRTGNGCASRTAEKRRLDTLARGHAGRRSAQSSYA